MSGQFYRHNFYEFLLSLGEGVHNFSSEVLTNRFNQYLATKSVPSASIQKIGRMCTLGRHCWFNIVQVGKGVGRQYVFYINPNTRSRMNEDLSSYTDGM